MKSNFASYLLLCGVFIGGCATADKSVTSTSEPASTASSVETVASTAAGDFTGYQISGDDVLFQFVPSDYEEVTESGPGGRKKISELEIQSVSVAGDFNGWSSDTWKMSPAEEGTFELKKSLDAFKGQNDWQFKFVLNGSFWAEPQAGTPNCVPSGEFASNQGYNLVLHTP